MTAPARAAERHPKGPRLVRTVFVAMTALAFQGCTESIVHNGHAGAAILVPKDAPLEIMRAAKELQTYVLKTSGAELRIGIEDGRPRQERVEIRLAVNPLGITPGGDPGTQLIHKDGYAIRSSGRMITIMGGSPRGTLYGVYDFIERALGVRWFMPTPMGEDILEAKTIPVPELDLVTNPAFPSVSGFTWAGSPGAEDWELRMRVRVGQAVNFGHNWFNIYPFTKENFAKNPEMFAMVGGVRGRSDQLCTSNPEVVRTSADAARAYFKAHPEAPLFSISPNDGAGLCECDRCRRIDARYGVTDGARSDRFVHYANEVLADLEKTHPDKQLGIYAYAEYTSPPRKARPRANYVTALTHMPWEFCHVHAIDDPGCPANRRFLSYLKGWLAVSKHVGMYEYYGHFFAFTPWPIVHSLRRDIPLFHELGLERFISETQQNWANQGINFYVAARLVSDPGLDVDALLSEYFSRFYGKASGPMRQYFDLWESAMLNTTAAGDHGYAWLSMFTPSLVAQGEKFLKQAETLAAQDKEKVRTRVAFARLGFRYTDAFAQMVDAGIRGDVGGILEWSEEAQKRVLATEGSAPQAFFVSLAVDQTKNMAGILIGGAPPWIGGKAPPPPSPSTTP